MIGCKIIFEKSYKHDFAADSCIVTFLFDKYVYEKWVRVVSTVLSMICNYLKYIYLFFKHTLENRRFIW